MRKAFSFARSSTSEQADGSSLARQLAAARAYCERHGLTLDEHTFNDDGVSAFIELVRDGRIPPGSVLLVENTDRLPPDEAIRIVCDTAKPEVSDA
jgi:DNA invertase Pin-like site-specific DNA recombinase